jgi:hypothetical protein
MLPGESRVATRPTSLPNPGQEETLVKHTPWSLVVSAVACAAAALATQHAIGWLRREACVPKAVIERSWLQQSLAGSQYVFSAPWPLERQLLTLPLEVQKLVTTMETYGHEADGLNIMAMRAVYQDGVALSLEGAADGAIANVRSMPGVASVEGSKAPSSVAGQPAYEVTATVRREHGEPLAMHGIVFNHGNELCQLILTSRADQAIAGQAWEKLRSSIK